MCARPASAVLRAAEGSDAGDPVAGASTAGARRRRASPFGAGRVVGRDLGPFDLESGARLAALRVAYRHDGPGPEQAPQVLVIHALTGSADAAGDWWRPLIGPGRALDTERVGVLSANLLGGRYGTTGPTSPDPATGRPYGTAFPSISTRDQARAQWALLDALGVPGLALVLGGSLGGMVSLEVALERPAAVRSVVPIAAPAATGALAVAWNAIQLELLERLGEDGLILARALAVTTYRSEADFDLRFGRAVEADGTPSLVRRFDPDTYRTLVGAMDRHDIGAGRGGVGPALALLGQHGVHLTGLGISGDILYGPEQVRALVAAASAEGARARYVELASHKGHDGFLTEWEALTAILRELLDEAFAPRLVFPPRA